MLLLLLACSTPPDPAALWPSDPEGSEAALRQLEDPLARQAAVFAILEDHPEASARLCPVLPPGPGRERCEKLSARPHLWTPGNQKDPPRQDRTRLRLPAGLGAAVPGAADPGDCEPADHVCLSAAALAFAAANEPGGAVARCRAIADERWQRECFFTAAEAVAEGPGRARSSLALCAESGSYLEMCIGHALLGLQSDDLTVAPTRASALREALGADATPIVDLFWCQAAHRLLERQPAQYAAAKAQWGAEAAPHLRSALALTLRDAPDPASAFAAAEAGAPPPPLRIPEDRASERLLWHRDFPGEESIAAVPILHNGADRRATSPDPALDARLALLSTAGHATSPDLDPLTAALDDPEPLIRWTAARQLSQLDPQHPALAKAATDPDPRVQARSKPGFASQPSRRKAKP